jgi:hypothetical protein
MLKGMKRFPAILALLASLQGLLGAANASAEPTSDERRRAAAAFDEGVARFKAADYPAAAQSFLVADGLVPNALAIRNAIAAGRRANDFLLVAQAAERILGRPSEPALTAEAREALSEASSRLALVDLSCDVDPCTLSLDGTRVAPGAVRVVPGTHDVEAEAAGHRANEHVNAVAGATYRLSLHPAATARAAVPPAPTSPPAVAPSAVPKDEAAPAPTERRDERNKKLSPAVFYAGAGVSAVLVGLTTWSGLDTLAERRKYDRHDQTYDRDTVYAKMHRTDALLGASIVVSAVTAYVGLRLVDWKRTGAPTSSQVGVWVQANQFGAGLSARAAW